MPTYSRGAVRQRSSYPEFFRALNITTEYCCRMYLFEDSLSIDKGYYQPPVLRERSRGRHEPGSGNYWCATAKPRSDRYVRGSYTYLVYYSVYYIDRYGYEIYESFDGYNDSEMSRTPSGLVRRYDHLFEFRMNDSNRNCRFTEVGYLYPNTYEMIGPSLANLDWSQYYISTGAYHSVYGNFTFYGGDRVTDGAIERPDNLIWSVENDFVDGNLLTSAYVSAFESLPRLTMNNIANIIDVISTVKDLFFTPYQAVGSLADLAKDAWLGYRYMYSTTKSDILDGVEYVTRLSNMRNIPDITGHGRITAEYGRYSYDIRCSVTCSLDQLRSLGTWAERFGLALDAYNLWDMIPFSFIVDWLLPIGSLIEEYEAKNTALKLSPSAIWYSITRDYTNIHDCHQCDYIRWSASSPPLGEPTLLIKGLSNNETTWVKRAADVLAITN